MGADQEHKGQKDRYKRLPMDTKTAHPWAIEQ